MGYSNLFVAIYSNSDAVTGSNTYLRFQFPNGLVTNLLVDCGSFLEHYTMNKNKMFDYEPEEIDAVIVTHGHIDHIGRLPLLVRRGYKGRIISSQVTANMMNEALIDNYKINKREGRLVGKARYDLNDIFKVEKKTQAEPFNRWIKISDNIKALLLTNGHILGAAMVYIQASFPGYENLGVLMTGDYKSDNIFFKVSKKLPYNLKKDRVVIVSESTYGTSERSQNSSSFFDVVSSTIGQKKNLLLPSFAYQRGLEVLIGVTNMQRQGMISKDCLVAMDGQLMVRYYHMGRKGKLGIERNGNILPEKFLLIDKESRVPLRVQREQIFRSGKPAIVIASSGNASFGASNGYLTNMIANPNCSVMFTGYCTEGTVGRELIDAVKGEEVQAYGRSFNKQAQISFTTEFSSHANADELIKLYKKFYNIACIVLTHGSPEAKKELKRYIPKKMGINHGKVRILTSKKPIIVSSYRIDFTD